MARLLNVFSKHNFIIKRQFCDVTELIKKRSDHRYDVTIIGGGIVGAATARELSKRYRGLSMVLVEKETKVAQHQSGHNSGVIHAGVYYKPGSVRAKLCNAGLKLSYKYFEDKCIPYKKVGKLIVATDKSEVGRLNDLFERGCVNRVPNLELIDGSDIPSIEPFCRGIKAIYSPETGIVDWGVVTQSFVKDFKGCGGYVYLNFEVANFKRSDDADFPIAVLAKDKQFIKTKYVITCGGLQSDKLAEMTGCSKEPKIVPIRGEYLLLSPEKEHMIKGNIYPVPNPKLPFLGVHFTPRMNGSVWMGPNAILAFKREGYKWSDFNFLELADTITYPGFIKLAGRHISHGIREIRNSAFLRFQMNQLRKYVPTISMKDIMRGPTGVRAQALDLHGNLLDDYVIDFANLDGVNNRILHCRNAPSPGATSSLAIAHMLADEVRDKMFS